MSIVYYLEFRYLDFVTLLAYFGLDNRKCEGTV
jgi:hypothetical protein